MQTHVPMTAKKELDFAVFCIENTAISLGISGKAAFHLLQQANLLNGYIIPCYEVLHTQDKEYIVEELVALLRRKGVLE